MTRQKDGPWVSHQVVGIGSRLWCIVEEMVRGVVRVVDRDTLKKKGICWADKAVGRYLGLRKIAVLSNL